MEMIVTRGPTIREDGLLDELVVHNIETLHLERMSDKASWIGLYANGKCIHINLFAENGKLVVGVDDE